MQNKIGQYGLMILGVLGLIAGYHYFFTVKVAYVQTEKLVYSFEGMKEYQKIYTDKVKGWKSNIDTLQSDFQKAVDAYNAVYTTLSPAERKKREELLSIQETNFLKYKESIESQMHKEDNEMTQKALGQINSFIEKYGEEKGYDIIMGSTTNGSILYGKKSYDITDQLLEDLNKYYRGKK